jgi:hypothetical protein
MKFTCACGFAISIASLGESSTVALLEPAQAEVAKRLRAGVLSSFGWSVDGDVVRCADCTTLARLVALLEGDGPIDSTKVEDAREIVRALIAKREAIS